MTTTEALEKVRKLLRMTEDHGCTEAEARQAAMMAQRIMLNHKIELLDLAQDEAPAVKQPTTIWDDPLDAGKTRQTWRAVLAAGIARHNGCTIFWSGSNLKVVGTADNSTATRYIYTFCAREIDKLAKMYAGNGRTWINNWRIGAAQGVAESLREAREAQRRESSAACGTALVKVDEAIAVIDEEARRAAAHMAANLRLTKVHSAARHDAGARATGKRDGRGINVTGGHRPAIGGGSLRLKG